MHGTWYEEDQGNEMRRVVKMAQWRLTGRIAANAALANANPPEPSRARASKLAWVQTSLHSLQIHIWMFLPEAIRQQCSGSLFEAQR